MVAHYLERLRASVEAEERHRAAKALGNARGARAVVIDALVSALDDPGRWTEFWDDQGVVVGAESKEVAVAAAESLAKFGAGVLPHVLSAVDAGAPRCARQLPRLVRAVGPDGLATLDADVAERLRALVESLSPEGRYEQLLRDEALGCLAWRDPTTQDRAAILRARVDHPVFETRRQAERELGQLSKR